MTAGESRRPSPCRSSRARQATVASFESEAEWSMMDRTSFDGDGLGGRTLFDAVLVNVMQSLLSKRNPDMLALVADLFQLELPECAPRPLPLHAPQKSPGFGNKDSEQSARGCASASLMMADRRGGLGPRAFLCVLALGAAGTTLPSCCARGGWRSCWRTWSSA